MLCCALASEERVARRSGLPTALLGLGAPRALPEGRLVGFGVAGALVDGLAPGTLVSATRIVDRDGTVLWEGEPLAVAGARPVVLCDVGRVVDDPSDRETVAARSGAQVVDRESGVLARSRRLAGVLRAVIDTPGERVGKLGEAATSDGRTDWRAVANALVTEPRLSLAVALRARRAFAALGDAASELERDLRAGGSPTGTGSIR